MKVAAIALFLLAGALILGGISVVRTSPPGLGTFVGAFVVPGLLIWWGTILLKKGGKD